MDVRVFRDTPAEAQAWDAFVDRHPESTSDHLWAWRRILSEAFGFQPFYLGAFRGTELAGILPLFRIPRGLGRSALSSVPFGNYGGICADDGEAAGRLLDDAKALLRRTRSHYLELRHRKPMADPMLQPQDLYHRFYMPLQGDPDAMLKDIGRRNRQKLRQSQEYGLSVAVSRDAGQLYPIHVHTMHRLGSPCYPRRYFDLLVQELGPRVEFHFVMLQGTPIAFDLMLLFKRSLICQSNGSLAQYFKYRPNNLLFGHALEYGCQRGMTELDYCRSRSDSGTAEFKRRLHFTEEPLAYQYVVPDGRPLPQRNPSNPKYQRLIQAWQRLPEALAVRLGPTLVRYLA